MLERQAKYQREVQGAEKRAFALLDVLLTETQRRDLREKNFFYETAPSGRRYRVDRGSHGNVKVVNAQGVMIESLCVQPPGVPAGDAMAMQLLLIRTAEEALRETANITAYDIDAHGTRSSRWLSYSKGLLTSERLEQHNVLPFVRREEMTETEQEVAEAVGLGARLVA